MHADWIQKNSKADDFSDEDVIALNEHLFELRKISFVSKEESLVELLVLGIPLQVYFSFSFFFSHIV